jgi:hypothetical protein
MLQMRDRQINITEYVNWDHGAEQRSVVMALWSCKTNCGLQTSSGIRYRSIKSEGVDVGFNDWRSRGLHFLYLTNSGNGTKKANSKIYISKTLMLYFWRHYLLDNYSIENLCMYIKGRVRPRTSHEGPQEEQIYKLYSFFNLGAGYGWVVIAMTRPIYPPPLPPGKILYPLYRRLGGPLCRSGLVRNIHTYMYICILYIKHQTQFRFSAVTDLWAES